MEESDQEVEAEACASVMIGVTVQHLGEARGNQNLE